MDFRIADTFTDSLARLTGEEQKAAKTTAFDLQMNPASPGLSFHKLDKVKDKRFWSVRVSDDVRLIVHRTPESLLLCYVDHHDKAYAWAERRKLETHPSTGAAQLVEIRERVEEIVVPVYVPPPPEPPKEKSRPVRPGPVFGKLADAELLAYGVPPEWLPDVRKATEETVLALADHLPAEAAEALLELATGGKPTPSPSPTPTLDPFEHPDALRRFRVVESREELEQALAAPWERWSVFLHPAQKELVERRFNGPARVAGSAGTGKTVVAIHRAAYLARTHPEARLLLTTFSSALANALKGKLGLLAGSEPRLRERIDVEALDSVARRLHERAVGKVRIATLETIRDLLRTAAAGVPDARFSQEFLHTEWREVVDAWQLDSWEEYRDVSRLGRKTRLPENQRRMLWEIFSHVRRELAKQKQTTLAETYSRITRGLKTGERLPYDFVVVDEAQDVSVAQLRLLAALGSGRSDGLFFAGDLGQRIFQLPFSWKALGVDVRGRSATLRINYRTSHQIRTQADRLLPEKLADVDGNVEDRSRTISVFNGPSPTIQTFKTEEEEAGAVAAWLATRKAEGLDPREMAIFVRSEAELERAEKATREAGLDYKVVDQNLDALLGCVSIATMHLAKGLEFRAVAVMACDDEVLPLQARISGVTDEGDLETVYDTERHLLYVACTRARDYLLVSGVEPAS
ncbi:MAG: UvrD-helicase domain-containing protein, partial [Thermoanaerobaculia bacterium]|nr:UvrD-helicase domain-containing protein [Thermoanaerobaculia bacterium]